MQIRTHYQVASFLGIYDRFFRWPNKETSCTSQSFPFFVIKILFVLSIFTLYNGASGISNLHGSFFEGGFC